MTYKTIPTEFEFQGKLVVCFEFQGKLVVCVVYDSEYNELARTKPYRDRDEALTKVAALLKEKKRTDNE